MWPTACVFGTFLSTHSTGSALLNGRGGSQDSASLHPYREFFGKGAKPTQLTLIFKGASIWEGYGVLGVLSVPLPNPRTSMLIRFHLRGITGGCF